MSMLGNFIARLMNIIRAKGDLIVGDASGKPSRLPVGTDAHVLTADTAAPQGISYKPVSGSGGILPITTRGDLVVGNATGVPVRKARGTHGQVLTTDEGSPDGLGYKDPDDLNLQGDPSGVWYLSGGVDLSNNFLARLNPGDAGEPGNVSISIPGSMSGRLLLAVSDAGSPGRTFWLPGLHRIVLGCAASTPGTSLRLIPQIGSVDEDAENFEAVATFDTIYPTTPGDSSYVRAVRVPGDQVIDGLPTRRMALVLDFENTSAEANQLTVFGGFGVNHPTRIETFTTPAPAAEPPTLDGFDRDGIYYLGQLAPTEGGFPAQLTPGDGTSTSYGIAISQAAGVQTHRIGITAPLTPRLVRWPGGRVAFRAFITAELDEGNTAKITPLLMRYNDDLAVETFVCNLDSFNVTDGHSDLILYGRHGDIENTEGERLGLILQITVTGPDGLNLTISTGGDYPSNLYTVISPQAFGPTAQGQIMASETDSKWGRVTPPAASDLVLISDLAQPQKMKWGSPPSAGGYSRILKLDFAAAANAVPPSGLNQPVTIGGYGFRSNEDRGLWQNVNGVGLTINPIFASFTPNSTQDSGTIRSCLDRTTTTQIGSQVVGADPDHHAGNDYLLMFFFEWLNGSPSLANHEAFHALIMQAPIESASPAGSPTNSIASILSFGAYNDYSALRSGGFSVSGNNQNAIIVTNGTAGITHNVGCFRFRQDTIEAYSGIFQTDRFPSLDQMTYRGACARQQSPATASDPTKKSPIPTLSFAVERNAGATANLLAIKRLDIVRTIDIWSPAP